MFISDKFVFIHLPKTGGMTTMERLHRLTEKVDGEAHKSVLHLKSDYLHLPRFGFVRNPWAWYVSYASWCNKHRGDGPTWSVFSEGSDNFIDTIKRILSVQDGTDGSRRRKEKMRKIYKRVRIHGLFQTPHNYFDSDVEYGYFTWWKNELFDEHTELGQTENLTKDFIRIIGQWVDLDPNYIATISSMEARNVRTDKQPYQEYYDEELINMVNIADKDHIDEWGYVFEQEEKLA